MLRWFLRRCAWMLPTLLGVTFVTFLVLDLVPVDRAALEAAQRREDSAVVDVEQRELSIARLRVRYGLVDAVTLEPMPVWTRYGTWLWNAVNLRFHGGGEDPAE